MVFVRGFVLDLFFGVEELRVGLELGRGFKVSTWVFTFCVSLVLERGGLAWFWDW